MPVIIDGCEVDRIGALNRGLQYGDGLFETVAIVGGRPRFFDRHLARLTAGATRLGIALPPEELLAADLARAWPATRGVVKLIVTAGEAGRGYRRAGGLVATRICAGFPWPIWPDANWSAGVRVRWCRIRLGRNPALAGLKHLNRLEQVLARQEWQDAEVAEGLMLDDRDWVIGGTQSNLFAICGSEMITSPVDECGVAGIMRSVLIDWATALGWPVCQRPLTPALVAAANGLLLTNALIGTWPIRELAGRQYPASATATQFNRWLNGD